MKDKDTHLLTEAYNKINENYNDRYDDRDDPDWEAIHDAAVERRMEIHKHINDIDSPEYYLEELGWYFDGNRDQINRYVQLTKMLKSLGSARLAPDELEYIDGFFDYIESDEFISDYSDNPETKSAVKDQESLRRDPAAYYGVKGQR